ncbi:MAG TPA: hypothetical protein PLH23_09370 [Hyphomonadaceae bacterium]|nr:hypothetical protein [Hyphomonadaceae bacterium]HPI48466.1 hypothetical protein [Hyphomonadaceae bacterium]
MRTLILAALLLAGPAAAQPGQHKIGAGDWYGIGQQVGPTGIQSTWTIQLSLTSSADAAIDYPSLGCKAVLHALKRSGDEIEFREEITEGNCITGGTINVRYRDNRIFWFWSKPESGADASAVLYRDQPIG